jgi:hypothetical protein
MLILVAGVTGNIGSWIAQHALQSGHLVRGLGRSPEKLNAELSSKLESFVVSQNYYDIPALERAVSGVDAVMCAYSGLPELLLDAQLLLLRATERAGIKKYLSTSWNYDWRKITFGSAPIYDGLISFHAQVSITSSIKPLHIFSGMFAEVFFGVGDQKGFTPKDNGVWDPYQKSMDIYGTGNEEWCFTTESDAGKFAVALITSDDAQEGGFYSVCSFRMSLRQVREIYEKVRGVQIKIVEKGPVSILQNMADEGREQYGRAGLWNWHRYGFHANCVTGVWNLDHDDRLAHVKGTSLEDFLKDFPEI